MQHSLLSQALFPLDKKSFLQLLWLTIALHVVQQYSMGLVVIKLLHFSHMQNYVQIAENQSTGLLLFGGGEWPATVNQAEGGMSCDCNVESHSTGIILKVPPFRKLLMA